MIFKLKTWYIGAEFFIYPPGTTSRKFLERFTAGRESGLEKMRAVPKYDALKNVVGKLLNWIETVLREFFYN